jgi:hypothetical protein
MDVYHSLNNSYSVDAAHSTGGWLDTAAFLIIGSDIAVAPQKAVVPPHFSCPGRRGPEGKQAADYRKPPHWVNAKSVAKPRMQRVFRSTFAVLGSVLVAHFPRLWAAVAACQHLTPAWGGRKLAVHTFLGWQCRARSLGAPKRNGSEPQGRAHDLLIYRARVAELADALDLGSQVLRGHYSLRCKKLRRENDLRKWRIWSPAVTGGGIWS